jgi:hypothetical protein
MQWLLRSRTTFIWLLLILATALSWGVGHGFASPGLRVAGTLIIVVAFVKVRFVLLDFMELRDAPRPMRFAAEGWVIAVCSALVTLFLISAP